MAGSMWPAVPPPAITTEMGPFTRDVDLPVCEPVGPGGAVVQLRWSFSAPHVRGSRAGRLHDALSVAPAGRPYGVCACCPWPACVAALRPPSFYRTAARPGGARGAAGGVAV